MSEAGIVGGHGGEPWGAFLCSIPPAMLGVAGFCEGVTIEDSADVERGFVRKGIIGEEA